MSKKQDDTPMVEIGDISGVSESARRELQNLLSANNLATAEQQDTFATAKAWFDKERYDVAAGLFAQVLREKPDHIPTLDHLADISVFLKNYETAESFYREIIRLQPANAHAYIKMARCLALAGKIDDAHESIGHALKISPEDSLVMRHVADFYLRMGKVEEAKSTYLALFEVDQSCVLAYTDFVLVCHKVTGEDDPYYKILKDFERGIDGLDDIERPQLLYALAKAHKDRGDFDGEFDYLIKAGKAKRATLRYDSKETVAFYNKMKAYFTTDVVEKAGNGGFKDETPVFITGMPRTGSTLLESILCAHEQVGTIGEDGYVDRLCEIYSPDFPENEKGLGLPDFNLGREKASVSAAAFGKKYVDYLYSAQPQKKRVINKSMSTYMLVGIIALTMRDAKIIHMKRNTLDSALSCFSKHFTNDTQRYSYDLQELGEQYREYLSLMDFWQNLFPDRIMSVNYEDLVAEPESHVRAVLEFLNLPWDENCLSFYKVDRVVDTASNTQVSRPIYKSSVGVWQRYAKHLGPLVDELGPYAPEGAASLVEK